MIDQVRASGGSAWYAGPHPNFSVYALSIDPSIINLALGFRLVSPDRLLRSESLRGWSWISPVRYTVRSPFYRGDGFTSSDGKNLGFRLAVYQRRPE